MSRDRFIGAWRVSEYVYEPDGRFAGIIRQRRRLEDLGDGRTRVTQSCDPEAGLEGHPMGAFRGTWSFDLVREGRARRYLGPDVIGSGYAHGPAAMTGRGLWPRFGHGFTSYSLLDEGLQITGGCFWDASALVARIAGIALPESESSTWPELSGPEAPEAISPRWVGTLRAFSADGSPTRETEIRRRHGETSVIEEAADGGEGWALSLAPRSRRVVEVRGVRSSSARGDQEARGIGLSSGWLREVEIVLGPAHRVSWIEVLDAAHGRLLGLRKYFSNEALLFTEVLRLTPER